MNIESVASQEEPSVPQFNARDRLTGKWVFAWPYRGRAQCVKELRREVQAACLGYWWHSPPTEEHKRIAAERFEIIQLTIKEDTQ